jgi:hypothetical protein
LANPSEIKRLAERKRLLLGRIEQHRQQMAAEMENLHTTAVWIERGYITMKRIRAVWPILATAAGFLIARKGRVAAKTSGSLFGKVRKILSWWHIGRKLTGFLRNYPTATEERSRAE